MRNILNENKNVLDFFFFGIGEVYGLEICPEWIYYVLYLSYFHRHWSDNIMAYEMARKVGL